MKNLMIFPNHILQKRALSPGIWIQPPSRLQPRRIFVVGALMAYSLLLLLLRGRFLQAKRCIWANYPPTHGTLRSGSPKGRPCSF